MEWFKLLFNCFLVRKTFNNKRLDNTCKVAGVAKVTVEKLAEVLGLLCAEGSHSIYVSEYLQYDKRRKKAYPRRQTIESIEFTNYDTSLMTHFTKLMHDLFTYSVPVTGTKRNKKARIRKKEVMKKLLEYTDFGHKKWRVPDFIKSGNHSIKAAFLRGLFDGDGSVDFKIHGRVRLTSVNSDALKDVKTLLDDLKIVSTLNGPYFRENRQPSYYINIYKKAINRYIRIIGSSHPKKKLALKIINAGVAQRK